MKRDIRIALISCRAIIGSLDENIAVMKKWDICGSCGRQSPRDCRCLPNTSSKDDPKAKFKSWSRHLTARAYDNSIFIAAVNQVGDNGCGLSFPGVAMVIDPSGNIYEKYTGDYETMLVADLKKSAMEHVRGHRMRYFLPNRRPEIYDMQ